VTDRRHVVRAATPADAVSIARVHVASWRAAYIGLVPAAVLDGLSVERREARWRATTELPMERRVWVVEVNARIVGFASTGPARDEDLPIGAGELEAIYLAAEFWSTGLGRPLFDRAVGDLRERGLDPLILWVLTGNVRGCRFYDAMGWRADGCSRPIDFEGTAVEEVRYRSP